VTSRGSVCWAEQKGIRGGIGRAMSGGKKNCVGWTRKEYGVMELRHLHTTQRLAKKNLDGGKRWRRNTEPLGGDARA